jgi:amino acid transporter
MFVALGMLVVVYSLIATSMFAVGYRQMLFGTELQRQPIPHVVWASLALGPVGYWCMIVTSLFMSLTTFNAGLMSVSRFVYASAREHVLPRKLEHVSSRFATPDAAVLAIYLVALVISLMVYYTGRYVILINLAAATECFIYAVAGACVIRLRLREPDRERPFRMVGGVALPGIIAALFLVIGVGVFASRPFVDYWGAAVLLALFMGGWAAYVHSVVMPRKERARAEQAVKRKSRRPPRPPSQEPDGAGDTSHRSGGGPGDGLI